MKAMFTVYFDTSFYVKLARANEFEAGQTVDALNELEIRNVISDVLIRELLTSRDRTDLDKALVSRLRRFTKSSFSTREDLSWDVLLLSGTERVHAADLLRNMHDMMSMATSFSIMARREIDEEQATDLGQAARPLLQQLGFPDDLQKDIPQVVTAVRNMIGDIPGVNFPANPSPESLFDLSEQIKGLLDPIALEKLQEEARIQDSSTLSEDRPYRVAAGTASDKTKKKLSNTLRDTEHIVTFINNRDDIDVLQVDKVHERIIKRPKPHHRLAELGMADRCFSSDSLPEAVEKIRGLRERES